MPHHIKTAISLEPSLFDELVSLARSMRVSRSHLLAQALAEYLERRQNQAMLARINDAYAEGPDEAEQAILRHAGRQHRKIVGNES